MDLPTLNAIIRLNGLTSKSSPENISDVLLRSGYTSDEVPQALAVLQGAPPPPETKIAAAYVEPILKGTSVVTHIDGEGSLFVGRIGVRQFWIATLAALGTYALMFVVIEVSTIPLFSLISGVSLFSLPDLATAPIRTLLVLGIGFSMLMLPAIFFLVISLGLQVRRCHDYGLSGIAWLMILLALTVSGYLLYALTPLASLAAVGAVLIWLALLSWPGSAADNVHGSPVTYPSVWASLCGCFNESENLNRFAKRFLLPIAYLQIAGLALGFFIHTVSPRVHLPDMPTISAPSPAAAETIHI